MNLSFCTWVLVDVDFGLPFSTKSLVFRENRCISRIFLRGDPARELSATITTTGTKKKKAKQKL